MHELTNRSLSLDDLLGASGRELAARLCETRGRAFEVMEAFFADRIEQRAQRLPAAVLEAWCWLVATQGAASIGEVAARVGWSRKRLASAFRDRVGLPPKTLARVLRFDRAMRLLKEQPGLRWSDAALVCGYYDQAHLTREVRELSGQTPRELAGHLLPGSGGMTA